VRRLAVFGILEKEVMAVTDDSAQEHARVDEEARRAAREAEAEARAEAEGMKADVLTGGMKEEAIRQVGLIYGGLILIGVYMVKPFLVAPPLDASAEFSVIAFAVAIPFLAAFIMINRQEAFRGRRTTSVTVKVAHAIALLAAFVGASPASGTSRGSPASRSWSPGSSRCWFTRPATCAWRSC
jgi:cation transport ATPase